jgi:hypothetical protein
MRSADQDAMSRYDGWVSDSSTDSRWDLAIELLLSGVSHKLIGERCGVHRNTISNWVRDPAFRIELSRRVDERMATVKLRRLHEVSRFVDQLHRIANKVLADAENHPRDRRAQRAAAAWLRNYRKAREVERQDVG